MVIDSNKNNQHIFPILKGEESTYSINPNLKENRRMSVVSG